MLQKRILTAVVGIPIVGVCLYLGGFALQALIFAAVVVGLVEFARLIGPQVKRDYLFAAGLSFILLSYGKLSTSNLMIWLFVHMLYFLIRTTFSSKKPFAAAENILGVFYVAVPFSFMWLLRNEYGFGWIVYGILVTWVTDTAAYFGGRKYGRRKLAPAISPNKSVEGAIWGGAAGMVLGGIYALWLGQPLWAALLMSLVLSAAGQIGDLCESALKREKSVKDTGSILPGHGGILDRVDSLAFVLPLLYIFLTVMNAPSGL